MCIFCSAESLFFHGCTFFVAGLVNVVSIKQNANGSLMKTDNAITVLRWSNNNVIHGSQRRYFFHKTKVVRLEKGNYVVVEFS